MDTQTWLEKISITERNNEIVRSDYNKQNRYDENCDDAKSSTKFGTTERKGQGKGTGFNGGADWLPDHTLPINTFTHVNYDTSLSSMAGNNADNKARNEALTRSLYSEYNRYDYNAINMSLNEGQFDVDIPYYGI